MDRFFVFVWVGVGIFLMFKFMYHDQRLKRYIDRQYSEEGKIVRLYESQSVGRRTLRTLVKKQRAYDPELACLARKAKLSIIYCIAWLIVMFLITWLIARSFIVSFIY
jgi:hypothetical protein